MTRRVINVSSAAAQSALPGETVYYVAQAGIEKLTRVLAAEQQAPSFRAIAARPGVMDTDMQADARAQPPDVLPGVELLKEFIARGGWLRQWSWRRRSSPGSSSPKLRINPGRIRAFRMSPLSSRRSYTPATKTLRSAETPGGIPIWARIGHVRPESI
jgi:NAD(P)-dependent dehydrogenase (short-subunit alcohol dehydrogenase family)